MMSSLHCYIATSECCSKFEIMQNLVLLAFFFFFFFFFFLLLLLLLSVLSLLLFCYSLFFIVLSSLAAPSLFSLIGPNGPVSAPVGSSVTLPCALSPSFSAVPLQVRWYRPNAFGTPVLLYEEHQVQTKPVDPLYQGRASLVGDLEKGEVSLRLTNLTLSDRGQYVCFAKSTKWYSDLYISLTVKVIGSVPVIWYVDGGRGQVNVTCESEGWFPEPTLTWRDRRGTEISSNSSDVCLFTDEEGLMGVGSWLLFSPLQSEWLSCSVGLSDQETTESRVVIHTRTTPPSVCTNGQTFSTIGHYQVCFSSKQQELNRYYNTCITPFSVKHAPESSCLDNSDVLTYISDKQTHLFFLDAAEQQAQTTDSVTTMEIVVTTIAVNLDVDVETVPPFLKVQDNYTSVYCPNSQKASLTEKKIFHADPLKASITDTALPHALCNKCFSSGKHYWEVQVGKDSKQSWYVGVCTKDAVQTDSVSLHPENGFWVLHYERGTGLFANTQPPTKVPVRELFKTVGVFLNCDEHTLTFYNADKNVCLCHFYVAPNVAFIPLISPGVREQKEIKLCHRQTIRTLGHLLS
ncbi:hypothetical protein ACEWY4_013427 [Coilia grayii]|uniref:Butyrophilin subfamily 1 member A1-like n=1 Tax=Coilia grayii TaxID=363190 RepID=A0ABD1JW99_9TELE